MISPPTGRLARRAPPLAPGALLAIFAACAPPADPAAYAPVERLTELLPVAEVEREPGRLDLGTESARPHLVRGWSGDEEGGGATFVWSEGPESEVRFSLAAPRDLELRLVCEPFTFPGAPEQAITLAVNGEEVGRLPLPRGAGEHSARLPAGSLRAGENRLLLRYAWSRSPRETSGGASADERRLAVRCDALDLGTGTAAREVRATRSELVVPAGARVSYYRRVPARSALVLERVTAHEAPGAELVVEVREAGGETRTVRVRPRGRAAVVPLTEGPGLVQVSLSVPADPRRSGPRSALVLRRPTIGVPRPAAAVAAAAATDAEGVEEKAATPAAGAAAAPAADRAQEVGVPVRPAAGVALAGTVPPRAAPAVDAGPDAVPAAAPRRPNVLVYLIDTLRRDGLGCYGHPDPVSPHIDALAERGIVFEHAVAQSPWTRPSVASIFTGLWPRRHGVNRIGDALPVEVATLAELLGAAGYRTHGVIANSSVARAFGFDQGFDGYGKPPGGKWWSTDVTEAALAWLDRETGEGPFFLYLHTVDPHAPYAPPADIRARFASTVPDDGRGGLSWLKRLGRGEIPVTPALLADLRALYDAEVAANDASFGELVAGLGRRGLVDDTAIVVLSDHGEEFFEHGGWDHGKTLYTEVLEVPWIARFPGLPEGLRVDDLVQHVDLLPTLLAYLGLPVPAGLDGRDLLPLLAAADGTREADDPAEADAAAVFSYLDSGTIRAAAVTSGRWRYIDSRTPQAGAELYDRRRDPEERRDVLGVHPVEGGYLGTLLRARELTPGPIVPAVQAVIDEELRDELRALGYLGDS